MSNLIKEAKISDSKDCPNFSQQPILEKLPTRNTQIGGNLEVRRALPHPVRRMIGPWCFFDHFGPLNLKSGALDVAPHPHMGLQTFTWTIAGDILHRDSLGSHQIIRPGQVNLMTAGRGIAHSEESIPDTLLHGVQLWIALPNSIRNTEPQFDHYATLPIHEQDELRITILAGESWNMRAPTQVYSPMIGLNIYALQDTSSLIPLDPTFEYGILALNDNIIVEGETIDTNTLLYLGCNRNQLSLQISKNTHAFLIGGVPFNEEILLWWNFVARTDDEIVNAVMDWENNTRFGEVKGYQGARLIAPSIKR